METQVVAVDGVAPWKRARIVAFYETYNPENLKNIPEILRVFSGREEVLCAKLHKKYGCHPDILKPEIHDTYDPNYKPVAAPATTGGPLDFRSTSFDARRALRQRDLDNLAQAHPLDNLYKCRLLLPRQDPHFIEHKTQPHTAKPPPEKVRRSVVVPKKPPLLHAIAELHATGPLSLLRACLLAKAKVVVVVRRICSIRGTCTGYLKGFDKHMNVVLLDVTERYVPLGNEPEVVGLAQWATKRNRTAVTRHANQLLIRGDNIVMVYPTHPLPQAPASSTPQSTSIK
ncbi:Aste57867_18856 [Aphanomyces stellatus]|uniref:Aste57867_18856 protein n=1 Tax=Aphanomyces stellatus TaxID=120398 RepID=A0A485LBH7_9STRA|nr:hypothetical protein As57867_018792 [Aphanomyces stellatus]VFT95590.1 Aste57867_18856 [Aphanomyces stellatus]